MEEIIGLLKLLPQGVSVTAVIIVVTMFLKHLKEMQQDHRTTMSDLAEHFTSHTNKAREEFSAELRETRSGFSGQLESISNKFSQAIEGVRDELRRLSDKVQ